MRTVLLSCVLSLAAAGLVACSGGSGAASKVPVTIAGCITEVDGNYVLVPGENGTSGPVGTSGRDQKRYKLVDDVSVGVGRYVNREARITGRAGETQPDGTSVVHVTQMTGGGECNPAK